jgi:hypothetical protein
LVFCVQLIWKLLFKLNWYTSGAHFQGANHVTSQTLSADKLPVKVGLVGYGWWGKIIARQVADSPFFSLTAVAEAEAGARSAMATDTKGWRQ